MLIEAPPINRPLHAHARLGLRLLLFFTLALAMAGCVQVRCENCQYGEYSLAPKSTADPHPRAHFPALKYAHQPANSDYRHIYLEGDGRPWHKGRTPSTNPTSRQKLALQLMQLDKSDSLYLNRPCYDYRAPPSICTDNRWWTSARYSEAVIAALDEALNGLQAQLGPKPLILIGHSGGGTLALLLAQNRSDVRGVITLAGNLAPHQWAAHHGYLPLQGSLKPDLGNLKHIPLQWHYVGQDDANIPPALTAATLADAPNAQLIQVTGNHNCCWREHWPGILARLHQALAADIAHK